MTKYSVTSVRYSIDGAVQSTISCPTTEEKKMFSWLLNSNRIIIIIIITTIIIIILALNRRKFCWRTNYSMADCILAFGFHPTSHIGQPNSSTSSSDSYSKLPYVFFLWMFHFFFLFFSFLYLFFGLTCTFIVICVIFRDFRMACMPYCCVECKQFPGKLGRMCACVPQL